MDKNKITKTMKVTIKVVNLLFCLNTFPLIIFLTLFSFFKNEYPKEVRLPQYGQKISESFKLSC